MKTNLFISIIICLTLITSCNLPEHYFESPPDCVSQTSNDLNVQKQSALVSALAQKNSSDYRYFFKTFIEEGDQTFMITNFRNKTECFDIKLWVDKWDKLEGMRKVNGKAYPKELFDLTWEIISEQEKKYAKYIDMHHIID